MSSGSDSTVPHGTEQPDTKQTTPLILETIPAAADVSQSSHEAMNKNLQHLQELVSAASPSQTAPNEPQMVNFFEELILSRAKNDTPCIIDMATATAEEKAIERERRLAAPTTRHRFIFQEWPRDPKGKIMMKDGPERQGQRTSNGLEIWGATLFDFYTVRRIPSQPIGITFSSGSRLAVWMMNHGETYALDQLQMVVEEEEPHLERPYPIGQLIKESEERPNATKSWQQGNDMGKKRKRQGREDWELPDKWPPESIFSPNAYPSPWPDRPFRHTEILLRPPTLHTYMTQAQLPAKLIVHDPAGLLHAEPPEIPASSSTESLASVTEAMATSKGNPTPADDNATPAATTPIPEDIIPFIWNAAEDITHVYKLTQSTTHTERANFDEDELEESDASRRRIRQEFLDDPHSSKSPPSGILLDHRRALGPSKPPIYIVFPHLPERGRIPEAHLYLSPSSSIGTGGHSYVYRAELELPRSFLVDEVMCPQCAIDDMEQILEEQDGPNHERRNPKWDALSGRYDYRMKNNKSQTSTLFTGEDGVEREYLLRRPEDDAIQLTYDGPYRAIESRVQYHDLAAGPYCEHLKKENIHPLTAKVSVAAKLSINGDEHLAREAENYQAFPRHFFEYWNGYNIIYSIPDPVPVTPVVPQYYGYYVVDKGSSDAWPNDKGEKVEGRRVEKEKAEEAKEDGTEREGEEEQEHDDEGEEDYLSPILLLEDCGASIEPEELSVDDRNECAALIYKFHQGGWSHGSVARRNIVRQPGPLIDSPEERLENAKRRNGLGMDWNYRLIDFGRSRKLTDLPESRENVLEERGKMENWIHDGPLQL